MNTELRNLSRQQLREIRKEVDDKLLSMDSPGTAECNMQAQVGRAPMNSQDYYKERLEHIFTFHDSPDKVPHYVEIREAAKQFAAVVCRHAPICPDTFEALRYVRQAVMWANAAIALDGRSL